MRPQNRIQFMLFLNAVKLLIKTSVNQCVWLNTFRWNRQESPHWLDLGARKSLNAVQLFVFCGLSFSTWISCQTFFKLIHRIWLTVNIWLLHYIFTTAYCFMYVSNTYWRNTFKSKLKSKSQKVLYLNHLWISVSRLFYKKWWGVFIYCMLILRHTPPHTQLAMAKSAQLIFAVCVIKHEEKHRRVQAHLMKVRWKLVLHWV